MRFKHCVHLLSATGYSQSAVVDVTKRGRYGTDVTSHHQRYRLRGLRDVQYGGQRAGVTSVLRTADLGHFRYASFK